MESSLSEIKDLLKSSNSNPSSPSSYQSDISSPNVWQNPEGLAKVKSHSHAALVIGKPDADSGISNDDLKKMVIDNQIPVE